MDQAGATSALRKNEIYQSNGTNHVNKKISTFFIATVKLGEVKIGYVQVHCSVLGVCWRDGVLGGCCVGSRLVDVIFGGCVVYVDRGFREYWYFTRRDGVVEWGNRIATKRATKAF